MLFIFAIAFILLSQPVRAGVIRRSEVSEPAYRNASFEEPEISPGSFNNAYGLSFVPFRVSQQSDIVALVRYEGNKAILTYPPDTGVIKPLSSSGSFNLRSFVVGCYLDRGIASLAGPLLTVAQNISPELRKLFDTVLRVAGPAALLPVQCKINVSAKLKGGSVTKFQCPFLPGGQTVAGVGLANTYLQRCPFTELKDIEELTVGPVESDAAITLVPGVGSPIPLFDSFEVAVKGT